MLLNILRNRIWQIHVNWLPVSEAPANLGGTDIDPAPSHCVHADSRYWFSRVDDMPASRESDKLDHSGQFVDPVPPSQISHLISPDNPE